MKEFSIKSFAKINCFLHVTGKRSDGFHELYSLMAPIDLCDELDIRFEGQKICVICDHPDVPEDETNLAHRAADLFLTALGERIDKVPVQGVHIRIKKQIPVGGGLGGGSSNAATVLMAMNTHLSHPFSKSELMTMGLVIGADVPFFMVNGPAFASGVGERLVPCSELSAYYLVLCSPGVAASTAKVFKKLEFGLTFRPEYNKNTGSNMLALGQELDGREELHNDLEGSACSLYPGIGSAKEEMGLLLRRNVYMSGSGSSLFALFSGYDAAKAGYELLRKAWFHDPKQVFLSRIRQSMV